MYNKFAPRVKSVKRLVYIPRINSGFNGIWTKINIFYSTKSAPNTFINIMGPISLALDASAKTIELPSAIQNPSTIRIVVESAYNNFSSCAEMEFYSLEQIPAAAAQSECPIPVNQLGSDAGTIVNPLSVTASSQQSGYDAGLSIDRDPSTIYHSSWSPSTTSFPVVLTYTFNGQTPVDAIKYYPRQDSNDNGYFGNVKISYNTSSDPSYTQIVTQNLGQDGNIKKISLPSTIIPLNIKIEVLDGKNNFASCAEMQFLRLNPYPTENPVYPWLGGTTVSSAQSGYGIDKTLDGNSGTIYHSQWSPTPATFPIVMNYRFDGQTPMNTIRYVPRVDPNDNGYFGNVRISYNTLSNPNFVQIVTQNLGQDGNIKNITLPSIITPLNIKIEVLDGKNNYASCSEMQFFKKEADVFSNSIFSELKSGVTQQDINSISSPFFKALAQCLFNGTYNKKYRVKTYQPYKKIETISAQNKVANYNQFENSTGILFKANTTAVIFAQNINPNNKVFLRVTDFANENTWTDYFYELNNGANTINIKGDGLGYIYYYTDDASAQPVTLNITAGIVNGIFTTGSTTPQEWKDMLTNEVYPKIDMDGYYAKIVMHKQPLLTYSPNNGQPLLDKYDAIVKSQRELMGFFKYNRNFKNRMFAYTEAKNGWYAGGLGAHFDITWGASFLTSPNDLAIWGIAHEFGHTNQVRPGIKWVGTSEVTNNLYSVWAAYNIQTPKYQRITRLEEEDIAGANTNFPAVAGNRFGEFIKQTFVNKKSYADGFIVGNNNSDNNFRALIPFWQLELYYQLAGASKGASTLGFDNDMSDEVSTMPIAPGIDYAHWLAFDINRVLNTNDNSFTNGQLVMNFVKNTCDAVQENLVDFFTNTGFLVPIDAMINDYSNAQLTITQSMIDEVKSYVASKGYAKPKSSYINYISANNVDIYKNQTPLTGVTGVGANVVNKTQGRFLEVDNSQWNGAVAYETYTSDNQLISVSIKGTGDPSLVYTYVNFPANGAKVYARGFDGKIIQVYPAVAGLTAKHGIASANEEKTLDSNNNSFTIYPNPLKQSDNLTISLKNAKGNYTAKIYSVSGSLAAEAKGSIKEISESINNQLKNLNKGIYLISISNDTEKYNAKLIKE